MKGRMAIDLNKDEQRKAGLQQAVPCLAGVFQPLQCDVQQVMSNQQNVVMGWIRRGGPALQMAAAVPPNTNLKY